MREVAYFIIDTSVDFDAAAAMLGTLPGWRPDPQFDGERRYLDSADRGLLHHGLVLECDVAADTAALNLRRPERFTTSAAWGDEPPRTPVDVLDDGARQRIVDAVGSQTFVTVGRRTLRQLHAYAVSEDGKSRANIVMQQFTDAGDGAPVSLRVFAARRDREFAAGVAESLAAIVPPAASPAEIALSGIDLASAELPAPLAVNPPAIAKDEPIGATVLAVLGQYFRVLDTHDDGIRADLDTEFLHDYRIALRRMRSVFGAFEDLFDEHTAGLLKADLKWLNQATGGRRDLDVFLRQFENLKQATAHAYAPTLAQLREFIIDEREREQDRLAAALASERYTVFKTDWSALLKKNDLPGAGHDVNALDAAGESIWRTYRRIRKQTSRRETVGNIDALHTLRKDCKRLRYQIEAFQSLFPPRRLARAVAELKHLQDILGAVCDLSVQQRFLRQRSEQLAAGVRDPGSMQRLLDELLGRHAEAEARLRETIQDDLDRFGGRKVMRRYRKLFAPHY